MKKSFETSDYYSEHFPTVPFLSEINKRPIVSIKSCVSSRVKGCVNVVVVVVVVVVVFPKLWS